MRNVSLFIAMSLDGFIADSNGSVNWLQGDGSQTSGFDAYSEFIKQIDTVIMGWNTYHQIVTELSPNEWVYHGLTSYVLTHKSIKDSQDIHFINSDPIDLINQLKQTSGKDIWICGGANLINQLIKADLIDTYYITIIPTLLGSGIRLFDNNNEAIPLKLKQTNSYNGMVDLIYTKR